MSSFRCHGQQRQQEDEQEDWLRKVCKKKIVRSRKVRQRDQESKGRDKWWSGGLRRRGDWELREDEKIGLSEAQLSLRSVRLESCNDVKCMLYLHLQSLSEAESLVQREVYRLRFFLGRDHKLRWDEDDSSLLSEDEDFFWKNWTGVSVKPSRLLVAFQTAVAVFQKEDTSHSFYLVHHVVADPGVGLHAFQSRYDELIESLVDPQDSSI
jgi:hypothetical protein